MDGIILVNKEKGITSRDVVNNIGKKLNTRKIGHTGTLDPIATGLMILCVGKGLKLVELLTGHDKDYIAKVRLGIKTDTYDVTGNIINESDKRVDKDTLIKALESFNGEYEQVVPIYSSVKVNGKKLYEYAREKKDVVLPKHLVKISNIKLLDYEDNSFTFSVTVSSGTYIRSLINDIGDKLGVLMTMEELTRTRVGKFKLEDVHDLDIIPITEAIDIPKLEIDDTLFKKISNGVMIPNTYHYDMVMFTKNNNVVAIYKNYDGILKSYRGFN